MTYNWNTMVEITVPTGTNGWLYSGEVIINGVKVRFPVGTPTSVPEPAAVLLKKMIELEQEEDANTAKPQNHYVGDVTIPAGKTLTLEKGAKFVDNSGPSEVVILPEMVVTVNDGQGGIMTPLSATPTEGATAKVTYNGTEYPCTVALVEEDGMNGYALGNLDVMGLSGGNPDAPFVVILIPDGMDGAYGVVMPMGGGATPVTISIVQTEGAASGGESAGGGVMTARVAASSNTKDMTLSGCDKKFSEFMAAYKAGKLIRIIAATEENGDPIEYIGNVVYHAVMGGTNTFAIAMPYATGTTTKQFLILPGDGGAAIFTSFDND